MANAVLYFRNGYNDAAQSLTTFLADSSKASQKLEFIADDNLMEAVQFQYQNNVIDIPVPISNGTRKINKQENGLRSIKLIVKSSLFFTTLG